jgi:hypothetical protein
MDVVMILMVVEEVEALEDHVDIGQHVILERALIDDHMNQEMKEENDDDEEEQMVDMLEEKIILDRNKMEN